MNMIKSWKLVLLAVLLEACVTPSPPPQRLKATAILGADQIQMAQLSGSTIALGKTGMWSPTAGPGSRLPLWRNADGSDTAMTGGAGAVTSVVNSDGTLTISPTFGNVVASINLAHANVWTNVQTFAADLHFDADGTRSVGTGTVRALNLWALNLAGGSTPGPGVTGSAMTVTAQDGGIDGGAGAGFGGPLTIRAGNGGPSSLFGQTGKGGDFTIIAGAGGTHSSGGTARAGGQLTLSGGPGGSSLNGTPSGAGGITIYGGLGGANLSNTTGSAAGVGGTVQLIGGDGGDGGGGPILGGNGGDAIIDAGNGGANGGISGTVKLATNTGVDTRVGGDLRVYNSGTIWGIPNVLVNSHVLLDLNTARLVAQNAVVDASNASGTTASYTPWIFGIEFISDGVDFFNTSLGLNIMKFDNTGSISTFVLTPVQVGTNGVQLGVEATPWAALYSSRFTSPAGTAPTCAPSTNGGTASVCNCIGNDSVGRCFVTITVDGTGPDLLDVTFATPYESAPFVLFYADTGVAPTHNIIRDAYFTSTTTKATLNSLVTWGAATTFDFGYLFIGK